MDNKKAVDIFAENMRRITDAPEQKIVREIDSVRWSFKIFHGNYLEMIKPLRMLEDRAEAIELWDIKKQKELYRVFEEVGRLLFNYLAAASMLIDHTRRYVNGMYGDAKYRTFKEEYRKAVKDHFEDSDNHQIAKGLRNYIQHRNLPAIGSSIIYTQGRDLSKTFRISTDSLLEWDGWSSLAKEKLGTMGKTFNIRKFVEEYFHQVEDFHKWLWERQVEVHREDIERLNKVKEEAMKTLMEAGIITEKELKEYHQQFD
jgi:hypothetical protein